MATASLTEVALEFMYVTSISFIIVSSYELTERLPSLFIRK